MDSEELQRFPKGRMKGLTLDEKAPKGCTVSTSSPSERAVVPYKGVQKIKRYFCQICHDVASGIHYGVYSCEGCKAFFRRSATVKVKYICPSSNTCYVDVLRRKSCKSCRLRKCVDVGMNINAKKLQQGEILTIRRPMNFQLTEMAADPGKQALVSRSPLHAQTLNVSILPPALCLRLLEIDLPCRKSYHDNTQEDTELNLMASLIRLADRELLDIVHWAKSIPEFYRLNISDQARLIELSWMDILVIGVCFRSRACAGRLMYFAPDLILDSYRSDIAGMTSVVTRLQPICRWLHRLDISREEFVLLRFLVLLNCDADLMHENPIIRGLHSIAMRSLEYTVAIRGHTGIQRTAELIELIGHIRHASIYATTHLFELKEAQACPIEPFVRSLLGTKFIA